MTVVIVDGLVEVMFRLTVLFLINIGPLLVLSARVSVKVGHGDHCDPVMSDCKWCLTVNIREKTRGKEENKGNNQSPNGIKWSAVPLPCSLLA